MNPMLELELARKLVDRLLQFDLIEDRGERAPDGAVIWHPTESGRELQIEAQIAQRTGLFDGERPYDEYTSILIRRGLIEWDQHYRWKPTELAAVLLKLPCALAPPARTSFNTLH
jgi:hypothetical protein